MVSQVKANEKHRSQQQGYRFFLTTRGVPILLNKEQRTHTFEPLARFGGDVSRLISNGESTSSYSVLSSAITGGSLWS